MAAQHVALFLKSLSPSTHAILPTQAHADTHIPTFTLPLDFDPPTSLCVCYELSEKTQWIEWQRSKARPSNRPRWRGDGWLCVYECVCVHTSVYVHVWVTLCAARSVRQNMNMSIHLCFCHVLCFYSPENFNPYLTTWTLHTHTLLQSPLLWSVVRGSSDRFLIRPDPHMPRSWYAGPSWPPP